MGRFLFHWSTAATIAFNKKKKMFVCPKTAIGQQILFFIIFFILTFGDLSSSQKQKAGLHFFHSH